ncbi:MAG: hypothetical protein ABS897_11920 [Eubacteriales bacterium]
MIQLQIDSESDLYNPYDPSRKRIDEGVYQYLKSYFTPLEASRQTHDTLQIITDSAIDTEKFQSALQDAVDGDIAELDRQIAGENRRFLWELIVGVFFSVIGVLLAIILDKVLLAIISFLGSTCLGDAVKILVSEKQELKDQKKLISPLNDIRLEVIRRYA